ncbi:tol-pal system-associated acyl-CoA thioesterase [Candidatus Competibacter phosphatis]|uniref:Tol-pal system-associated acyl-CoA thioesterase n=1 Tax=Candidatus Competibacter phosphatis TaxID=221280 RepID=A0ABX1TN42_9GAMM|nr:tol-pal system-associated acyl-CoA thioesterase [Candidatus Competibacter phosphatis]NMQ20830.1 tol-pal system-associated acyl-CoA thioesterase [Candidatus Competibacter phosphatis]
MFVWPVRVYHEDTDGGGVVYYANYLKFMERARTEWLRARGFEQDVLLRDRRVLFAVRTLNMDYHRPARFNDLLEVVSRIAEVGGASLTFAQSIRRADSTEVLCDARVKVACIDAENFRARRLPRQLMREIVGDP